MTKPTISGWMFIRTVISTVVIVAFITGVTTGDEDNKRGEIESAKPFRIGGHAGNGEAGQAWPHNLADMRLRYKSRTGFRDSSSKRSALVSERAVYTMVEELRTRIKLPFDIKVIFEECGHPDSFYDEDTHNITICYELIEAYSDLFSERLKTSSARDEAAKGAIVSMFLHEVAHSLIHGWDLPITGREEDAADQFSTLFLLNGVVDGERLALEGARSFELLADLQRGQADDYSDLHSLDRQRFFNTVCLVYGHRPEQHQHLIRNGTLPAYRAFDCEKVYERASKSWETLLAPHVVRLNDLPQIRYDRLDAMSGY